MPVWTPYGLIGRGKLNIFIFHSIKARPDPFAPTEPDVPRFDALLGFLRRWFTVLPLDEAVRLLADGTLPPAAASITFDDGYADNLTLALPLLERHRLPATIFIADGYLDGGCMWNDVVIESIRNCTASSLDLTAEGLPAVALDDADARLRAIETLLPLVKYRPLEQRTPLALAIARRAGTPPRTDLMLTTPQLRDLARSPLITIGAHTHRHPILASESEETARNEISVSKQSLESLIDRPVTLFAYPNGRPGKDYRGRDVALVRAAGFAAAVSTATGFADSDSDRFQLPRFTPWDRTVPGFALRMARHLTAKSVPATVPTEALST
ncbi:MAG: polysaccharide deacetylase family protein [Burkholderiales bacterium]|nr:polysaccharide deacetylase family protein [Burkholderiales bacterium]